MLTDNKHCHHFSFIKSLIYLCNHDTIVYNVNFAE